MIEVIFINNLQGLNELIHLESGHETTDNAIASIRMEVSHVECEYCAPRDNKLIITIETPSNTTLKQDLCCDALSLKVLQKSPYILSLAQDQ